jgi:hypothetical protein
MCNYHYWQIRINLKSIKKIIERSEEKWLLKLYYFCKEQFKDTILLSHDQEHHNRVWLLAKELLLLPEWKEKNGIFVDKCLMVSFLHDIGMAASIEKNHGKYSKKMADAFFKAQGIKYRELPAILEYHDNKEYKTTRKNDVLTLLSIADDLDAYGAIGVYRYAEIYSLRGMEQDEIPAAVLNNAEKRFNFFRLHCKESPFFRYHEQRYHYLVGFFNPMLSGDYNLLQYEILDFFYELVYKKARSFNELLELAANYAGQELLEGYFADLQDEIRLFNQEQIKHLH